MSQVQGVAGAGAGHRGAGRGGGGSGRGGGRGGGSGTGDNGRGMWRSPVPQNQNLNRQTPPTMGNHHGPPPMQAQASPVGSALSNGGRSSGGGASPAFKTDRDISLARTAGHRELQQWTPDGSTSSSLTGGGLGGGGGGLDDETFGTAHAPKKWDQFAANEKLFGAQSDYHDELYTTRLDRSGKDFKARESKAARIAEEIQSATTNNPHVAEERGQVVEGEMDEEFKYSGVVRAANAYVPPGARKGNPSVANNNSINAAAPVKINPSSGTAPTTAATAKATAAHASHPMSDPAIVSAIEGKPKPPTMDAAQAAPAMEKTAPNTGAALDGAGVGAGAAAAVKPIPSTSPHDVIKQYRNFLDAEKEKVDRQKISIAKSEREQKLADLVKFGKSFKVPTPVPDDLLSIMKNRSPISLAASPETKLGNQSSLPPAVANLNGLGVSSIPTPASKDTSRDPKPISSVTTITAKQKIIMHIPEIPAFGLKKTAAAVAVAAPPTVIIQATADQKVPDMKANSNGEESSPAGTVSPKLAKLNPSASAFVFRPNPSASAFQPGASSKDPSSSISVSNAGAPDVSKGSTSPSTAPFTGLSPSVSQVNGTKNAFFGNHVPRRVPGINVKEDFNTFKGNVPDARGVSPAWPFQGNRIFGGVAPQPLFHGMPAGPGFDEDGSTPGSPPFPGGMPHGFGAAMNPNFGGMYRYPGPGGPMGPPPNMHLAPSSNGQYPPQMMPQGMYMQPGPNGQPPAFFPQSGMTPGGGSPYGNMPPPQGNPNFAPNTGGRHPPPNMYFMQPPPPPSSHPTSPALYSATPLSIIPPPTHAPPQPQPQP